MALTASEKAEIQSMIKAATKRNKNRLRKPSAWTPFFKEAIKEAVKEHKMNGGNYAKIKERYLKEAKAKYQNQKK